MKITLRKRFDIFNDILYSLIRETTEHKCKEQLVINGYHFKRQSHSNDAYS